MIKFQITMMPKKRFITITLRFYLQYNDNKAYKFYVIIFNFINIFFKQKTDIVNEVTYRYPIIVRWKRFYLEGGYGLLYFSLVR